MQEFSSGRYPGFVETNDALITGVRGVARRLSFFVGNGISNLLGRMSPAHFQTRSAYLANRREVEIMYVGRTSEFLMMTSERMMIPTGRYTLGQLLCNLYKRGDRWVDELDDSHLMCTVNGRHAKLFETIKPGAEIRISSRKSDLRSVNTEMMNNEIIHTAIWAGRMFVVAVIVLRVRFRQFVTFTHAPKLIPQRPVAHQIDAIDGPVPRGNPVNT